LIFSQALQGIHHVSGKDGNGVDGNTNLILGDGIMTGPFPFADGVLKLFEGWFHGIKVQRLRNFKHSVIQMLNFIPMKKIKELTAIIEREGEGYVALCPEFDIASQGDTIEEARANLIEALELFYETAPQEEIHRRFHDEVLITRVQVNF
jgi:predicted RNase H-like HicB family nuclease